MFATLNRMKNLETLSLKQGTMKETEMKRNNPKQ